MYLNNIKLINKALLIFFIFIFAPCIYANERTIEVSGKAKVSVVPDMATFSFSINGRGKELAALKNEIDNKTAALVALCKKLGIKTKNITSSEVSIRPQYNYQTKSFLGYEVSRNIAVILYRLEKYTELVNGAIKYGITTIRSIALDTKDREKLQLKALGAAVAAARKKAEILAKSSGVRLGKVINVKEGSSPIRLETFKFSGRTNGQVAGQGAFEPGEISITSTIAVQYAIK